MYVPGSEPVRYQGILEGDILAQCPYLPEVTVADHALRGIFRHTHQAVRPDDPSVCQYHGRTYNHSGVDLPDIHHRLDGNSHKRHDDNRIRIVHRVYELPRTVGGMPSGLYIHPVVGQLYRIGQSTGMNKHIY